MIRMEVGQYGSARIIIDRPEKRNAMSLEMWRELGRICESLEQETNVRSLVISSSSSDSFCAGADLSEFGSLRSTPKAAIAYDEESFLTLSRLEGLPFPTIAQIEGYCVGGGMDLAAACDFRIATPGSTFAVTPAKIGIVYGKASTRRLVSLVGPSNAKKILFSGRFLGTTEAAAMGLIDDVVEPAKMTSIIDGLCTTFSQNSAISIRGSKVLISAIANGTQLSTQEINDIVAESYASEDHQRRVRTFFQR